MKSTSIEDIEDYLSNAHPEDPKRDLLKLRLISLKNQAWTKGAKDAKPMAARPVVADITNEVKQGTHPEEVEEFNKLIAETTIDHDNRTASLLTTLSSQDNHEQDAVFIFQNKTECNLIVRLQGNQNYNLPVEAHGENFIVVKKGSYKVESKVCNINYTAQKNILKGTVITLNPSSSKK
ncbi:DUF6759 domain-containing protein [Chryseobacterium sp.]|uniref:DUF6759 domain-containing protein n=1 Tax=Chryseobacterium sp. TaxID=1871047 RepID=UPI0025BC8ACC|nr:DUF6759 domain-containing protein [Chryseobacterium sp.]